MKKELSIPVGLIFCNFVGYCIYEIFSKKNDNQKIFIFIILSFVLFRVNRYSDFGNDAPANLIFFYLIIETVKSTDIFLKLKKLYLLQRLFF